MISTKFYFLYQKTDIQYHRNNLIPRKKENIQLTYKLNPMYIKETKIVIIINIFELKYDIQYIFELI